jgi:uncharacterized protein YjbJ (UPF0337 family)
MQGKWRQVRGTLKTRWANLTDDDRRMLDGKIDQMVGLLQERYGYTQERAAHALKHYLGRYGKTRSGRTAGPVRAWRLVLFSVALSLLATASAFGLARLIASRRAESDREYAGHEAYANADIEFD